MKTIDYYMQLPYKLEIIPDIEEGGYAARYPELPGGVTCAENIDVLISNAEDAKRCWLEACLEDGQSIPEPLLEDSYSGQFKLRIPKSLHRSLAEHAKLRGLA